MGDRPGDGGMDEHATLVDLAAEMAAIPDVDRELARARLKAQMFEVETEPTRIGRFVILGRLGQGGMGTVFAAFDAELDRKIAVKLMHPRHGTADREGRDRTRREAQAMARLSHPNIVAVHEVGETGSQLYIAMEFVRGVTLDVWLAQAPRSWREVLDVFRRAGRGLAAVHAAGLIYRDFKPSNVMVADDGQVKLLDFGLARTADDRAERVTVEPRQTPRERLVDSSLTRTGVLLGTPAYMSAEQFEGKPATMASDQFSFCVALFLALYGVHPFGAETMEGLLDAVTRGAIIQPPRTQKAAAVPGWLRREVLRGLAVDPSQRHPSIDALLAAISGDPGRRRRLWGLGIASCIAAGLAIARLTADAPCPDGRTSISASWGEAERGRVAAALRDGAPHGEETWSRVEPALDAYAAAWASAHDELCQALRTATISSLTHARRDACLARTQGALAALVDVFERADTTVVDKAVAAVAALPPLARCDDTDDLLAVAPPDPAIAADVMELRDRLSRARAIEEAGRVEDSIAAADEVLAEARRLAYPPLVAEALLRRGSGELIAGDATKADEDLGSASWTAIAAGVADVAAEAAARRIFARSELRGRPADAEIELPWARALADRAHDDALLGLFLHNAATVESRAGHPERARELAQDALAARRRFLPAEHPDIALTLANLGHFERDAGEYASAVESLREAIRVTEIALGPRHPQRAMIGTVLATALLENGDDAAARDELARVDRIYRESLGERAMPRYYVFVAQGELAVRARQWPDARAALSRALELARANLGDEHPMLADARLALAEVDAATGDLEAAESNGRVAVEQLEGILGSEHPYVSEAWLRLGRLLLGAGAAERASPYLERARELARARAAAPDELAWFELWWAAAGRGPEATARMARAAETLADSLPAGNPRIAEARAALAAQNGSQQPSAPR